MTIIVTGGAGFIGSNFIFHMLSAHPDYRMIYSDRILKEVRKDFKSLAPLHRLLRGYVTETSEQ